MPDRYDDGGFSGGNIDRPALRRLLRDIEAGRIDCVVVYKVDRLSRSLLDFARIIEVFDKDNVSFVSVTQQFNTSNSMGRLTLNILLSFAQFEREIIGERTSDKMCAARRKGKWVGGIPMLGYDMDPKGGRLIVNEAEASQVREIFDLYLQHQSIIAVAQELSRRGWTTKSWVTKDGKHRQGALFDKANLRRILTNYLYIGKVNHGGTIYEGEHEAIVDEKIWKKVHSLIRRNGQTNGTAVRNKRGALLKGLVYCSACNYGMIHTYTAKKNKHYRYYVCIAAQKRGYDSCPTKSIQAEELERRVVERIRKIGKDPALIKATVQKAKEEHQVQMKRLASERKLLQRQLQQQNQELKGLLSAIGRQGISSNGLTRRLAELEENINTTERRLAEICEELATLEKQSVDARDLKKALSLFDPVWDELYPKEKARIIQLLIERIDYNGSEGRLAITFHDAGIKTLVRELEAAEAVESARTP